MALPARNRDGYAYICKKLVDKSRASLEILLLVPRAYEGEDLEELIADARAKNGQIFLLIDTSSTSRREIQTDKHIPSEFRVFIQSMIPPLHHEDFIYRHWLAKVVLPHLILSASKFVWQGITITLLFRHSRGSIVSELLHFCWNEVAYDIVRDVNRLIVHQDNYFCHACSPQCQLYMLPSHFQLQQFDELDPAPAANQTSLGVFTNIRFFDCRSPTGDEKLFFLHRMHLAVMNFSQDVVYDITRSIFENYLEDRTKDHCCYLLCVLQGSTLGPRETEDEEAEMGSSEISRLINDERVEKILYVGVTEGKNFREEHLRNPSSPVYRLLSEHARMFTLRKFITKSRVEAERNEAFVIELLKTLNMERVQYKLPSPFLLVNKNSGPASLLGLDMSKINEILDFFESRRPVFSATLREYSTANPAFLGEYDFSDEVTLSAPSILAKHYRQVAGEVKLTKSRTKNGRSFDYRV